MSVRSLLRLLLLLPTVAAAAHAAASPRVLLLDAARVGADLVTVGDRGRILHSADSGVTWDNVASPTTATLTGVSVAPDQRHVWAVGHDAVILASADAGRSWQKQWQGSNLESSFLDVCALDAQNVIAIGAYGLCMVTSDSGRTWTPRQLIDDDMHLNRITRGPGGTLYIAGERGTLLRSTDAGATWGRIDSPYDGSFYGVLPLDAHTLLAYGLRGRVFHSANDGDTWTPVPLDRPMLIATALQTRAGLLVLAGQARALYVSHDHGVSFAAWSIDFTDAVAELLEAPDGTLLAFGEAGVTRLPQP